MIIKLHLNILPLLALIVLSHEVARGQSNKQVTLDDGTDLLCSADGIRKFQSIQADLKPLTFVEPSLRAESRSAQVLSESQKTLVEGSKQALLNTGMSEPFFSKHFCLHEVIDKPGDRRVVWKISVNEYEATVNDSIGYRTEGVKRINVHSIQNVLSSTTDIKRTIPRTRALRIMRACVGKFEDAAVEYRAGGSGKAGLFLTASSLPGVRRSKKKVSDRKRNERESAGTAMPDQKAQTDVVEEKDEEDRPPVYIATVNLETGRCTKGMAQAGPPKVR